MKQFIYLSILMVFSLSCSAQVVGENITIDNILSNCISINKKKLAFNGDLLLLDTSWDVKNNIGACGCKSAALSYDVHVIGNNDHVSRGVVSTLNKKSYSFVINTDNSIFKKAKYRLSISCKN